MNDYAPTPRHNFASLKWRRILILATLVVPLAALGFVFTRHLIDFPVYYAAGRSLISGRTDLYAPDFARGPTMDYRYPPFFIVSLIPLWYLPYGLAAYVWHVLGVVAIVACCWATSQALSLNRQVSNGGVADDLNRWRDRDSTLTWVFTLLGVAQYYIMSLHYGNVQLLVTALLLCAFLLAILRRHDFAAAPLLALAITIKITPALFLIYFALKRRWRLVMTTTGLVVLLNLAPAAYFGFGANAELIKTWYRHVLVDQEFHEVNGPINLSLKGQLVRSLTRVDYSRRIDGDTAYPAVNIADYSYRNINRFWLALDSTLLVLALIQISRLRGAGKLYSRAPQAAVAPHSIDKTRQEHAAIDLTPAANRIIASAGASAAGAATATFEIGIVLCLMLLGEPLTSKIYLVALIWPLALVLEMVIRCPDEVPRLTRWGAVAVVAANVVLPLLPGRRIQRLLLVLGADFYLTCLVLAILIWALLARRRVMTS
jgi:hypothetical protein